ncbi:MAG: prephenate dehydratase [Bernardetiaceae bacterium]
MTPTVSHRVAIQGIKSSFHEQAAQQLFAGHALEIIPCFSFRQVAQTLKADAADYAVLAIENSIAGSILGNYRLIQDYHFKIVGELYVHIQMNLMALPGTPLEAIQSVYSHPIALQQCAEYLHTLPDVQLIDWQDTASAAHMIHERQRHDAAAVAGKAAAEEYGLEIIAPRIETNKQNFTRFLLLSKSLSDTPDFDKASISFRLGSGVGELAEVLTAIARHGINLTKVQSVPVIGKPSEYTFYLDLVWEENTGDYAGALEAVLRRVSSLSLLGEYKKAQMRYEG